MYDVKSCLAGLKFGRCWPLWLKGLVVVYTKARRSWQVSSICTAPTYRLIRKVCVKRQPYYYDE